MYKKWFYLKDSVWNNLFSFDKRLNKELYVPGLIKIDNLSDISLWENIVFEDYDFNWKLQSCTWLEDFYEITWNNKSIYLFDNHNHAFYFWYLAKNKKEIQNWNYLFHIDEHSDMRKPDTQIKKDDLSNLEKVFNYTNFDLNVWNYINPAIKTWIVKEVIQIRSDLWLNDWLKRLNEIWKENIILNLDLDFFRPELDYIDYKKKKDVILEIANKAKVITVATSPFFINQKLAIKVFKDLFNKKNL